MEGGTIWFCEASSAGGGIWNDGTITIDGAIITQNRSDMDGGGIWNNGTLTINSCTISGNQTFRDGGGIWNGGILNMKGYIYVWENYRTVSGSEGMDNVHLNDKTVVNITGSFQDGSTIGMTINKRGQVITNGYTTYHPNSDADAFFRSDKEGNNLSIVDNELILGTYVTFDVCSWDEENQVVVTQSASQAAEKLEGSHPDDWIGLDNGYYFVEGNARYKVINILGEDVHLILTDGCELYCNHIKLEQGHSLSIYSQSDSEETRGNHSS